jgi:hypothetical protein
MAVHPVVNYCAETWVIKKSAGKTLMTFQRKILRKRSGPVLEDSQWRIKTNFGLEKLYKEVNFGTFNKLQRLRWMGYLQRLNDARSAKKMYEVNLHQKRPKGRAKTRCKGDVEDIRKRRLLIGDKQRGIGMDGGELPGRRSSFLVSGATEEEEEDIIGRYFLS